MENSSSIRKVVFLGDYLPRKCGIASGLPALKVHHAQRPDRTEQRYGAIPPKVDGHYAMSDSATSFATVSLDKLLRALK